MVSLFSNQDKIIPDMKTHRDTQMLNNPFLSRISELVSGETNDKQVSLTASLKANTWQFNLKLNHSFYKAVLYAL